MAFLLDTNIAIRLRDRDVGTANAADFVDVPGLQIERW